MQQLNHEIILLLAKNVKTLVEVFNTVEARVRVPGQVKNRPTYPEQALNIVIHCKETPPPPKKNIYILNFLVF